MTENDNTQQTEESLLPAELDHLKWMARMESVRTFAQVQAAETAEFRLLAASLDRRIKIKEREIRMMRNSWTWRIGRLVLFPVTLTRIVKNRFWHTD